MDKRTVKQSMIEYYTLIGAFAAFDLARYMHADHDVVKLELDRLALQGKVNRSTRALGTLYFPII